MANVLVVKNDAPLNSTQLDVLEKQLPSSVMNYAKRYNRWQDAQAFLLGRYLLVESLRRYGFEKSILLDITYTKYNRPLLPIPFDFNISHSGNYILCAFSSHKVGVDIEVIRDIEITDFADCFSTDELIKINYATEKHNEFFKYWTIKEAVIKADGRGLSFPLKSISVGDQIIMEGNTWSIYKIDIDANYQSHLATNEIPDQGISTERISLTNKTNHYI